MARVKIIACDGQHPEGLVPADGRLGIQRGDSKAVWKDYCDGCLSRLGFEIGAGPSMNGNGPPRKKRRNMVEMRAMVIEMTDALKTKVWTGSELQQKFGMSYAQMAKTLEKIKGVRKIGERNTARWTLKKGKVARE